MDKTKPIKLTGEAKEEQKILLAEASELHKNKPDGWQDRTKEITKRIAVLFSAEPLVDDCG